MIVLGIGALLVAGLVVWALTRTIEPSTTASNDTPPPVIPGIATQTTTPTTPTPTTTQPTTDISPMPTTTAPAPVAPPAGQREEVARISIEDLRAKLNRGEVTVVDVRDNAAYQRGHIPGSLNIPMASTQSMIDLIPKGKPVVTYCT